ncbi:sensor histidine kinase [candidate division KSB1 bacterium]|nr:sensor histidine kinase [candidate division KSB1 bacterium]
MLIFRRRKINGLNKISKLPGKLTDSSLILTITGGLLILVITLMHYVTSTTLHPVHELLKASYFLPILIFAFLYGIKGGFFSALVITFLYLPHVMFQWGGNFVMNISRFLMILLYHVIGSLTGYLWQKEKQESKRHQDTSERLANSLRELKQSTEEKEIIESQLRTAERLSTLGELTASLAHEIRNPLGSIRGAAEILQDDTKSETNKKFVNILLEETKRLDSVVTNYLTFAKPRETRKQLVSLKDMINSTISLLGVQIRKNNLTVEININPENIHINCDENQIRQALLNILLNAIQATPAKGKILIESGIYNKYIQINIIDSGPGFTWDVLSHLFEPFYSTKENGSGLGLAITRRIIESHNGRIYAKNTEKNGAAITIEFNIDNEKIQL